MDQLLPKREATVRALFTQNKIPQKLLPTKFTGCETLRELQLQSFTNFGSYIQFALNFFAPHMFGYISAQYHTGLIILFGEPFDSRSVYPAINSDSFVNSTFMMEFREKDDNDFRFSLDKNLQNNNYEIFLEWYVEKLNKFIFHLSNPVNFSSIQNRHELDPERWLMTSITSRRIFHEAQIIQTHVNRNEFLRKIMFFNLLDKISNLTNLRCKKRFGKKKNKGKDYNGLGNSDHF